MAVAERCRSITRLVASDDPGAWVHVAVQFQVYIIDIHYTSCTQHLNNVTGTNDSQRQRVLVRHGA